jgi:diguanylate cyclase (GGDEF)-like protein
MLHSTVGELEAQRQALLAALERASTDGLTGLSNHAALQQRLEEEMARARRHEAPLAVVMLDLDHFKRINDTYGHPVGDAVLRASGALLRSLARESDVVGRYGGEEFAAILIETDAEGARRFAERFRAALAALDAVEVAGRPVRATVSVGVAARSHADVTAADLVARADRALYEAKSAGRDRTVVAVPPARRQPELAELA